ncbi:hypothetical protein [Streptomyces sp. 061-3]|uniref:hypothetical protein n=1 Tax=Streptomyces sp. 061-3 TaxID=2789268 RepID=UPI00397ED7AE
MEMGKRDCPAGDCNGVVEVTCLVTFEELADGSLSLKLLNPEDSFDHSCPECGAEMGTEEKLPVLMALRELGPVVSSDLDNHEYTEGRR